MASTINVLTTGVGGIQQTGDTSGILQMQKDGTATLTIDTSGNVGIGTSSPTQALTVNGRLTFSNLFAAANIDGIYLGSGVGTIVNTATGNNIAFNTGTTERMRIGSSGEIGLGGANYGTSGQFLTSNGPGAAVTWTSAAAGGFSNMTVFTSPGTFTTPSTTTKIKVTVVGSGGGGGANNSIPGIPGGSTYGGGGGGGGTAIYVGPVTASTGYAVTVGATPGAGAGGNTSSFGVLASATGGGGGGSAPTSGGGSGGSGGAGSAGTLQITGGSGGTGGAAANPNSSYSTTGAGGNSALGAGAGGSLLNSANNGSNYGGGGSGGLTGPGARTTGGAGVVIVEY